MNIAVTASKVTSDKFRPNRHGEMPLILRPLNGTMPKNSGILDGTVAKSLGIEPNGQYVLSINFRSTYTNSEGVEYPNYDYNVITRLGKGFEAMVAEKVVESIDFGFASTPTPTPTPAIDSEDEDVFDEVDETEEPEVEEPKAKAKK